jgi:hypothetical protein
VSDASIVEVARDGDERHRGVLEVDDPARHQAVEGVDLQAEQRQPGLAGRAGASHGKVDAKPVGMVRALNTVRRRGLIVPQDICCNNANYILAYD